MKKAALMRQICFAFIKPGLIGFINAQAQSRSGKKQHNASRLFTDRLCTPRSNGIMAKLRSKWRLYFDCCEAIHEVAIEKPPLQALYGVIKIQEICFSQSLSVAYSRNVINQVTSHTCSEEFLRQARAICDHSQRLLAACVSARVFQVLPPTNCRAHLDRRLEIAHLDWRLEIAPLRMLSSVSKPALDVYLTMVAPVANYN